MLDAVLEKLIAERHIPGLAIAIQQGDTRLQEGYYGYANLEHQVKVNPKTVFEIASLTKLFTAQAVLHLAQEKQLQLDHPCHHPRNRPALDMERRDHSSLPSPSIRHPD